MSEMKLAVFGNPIEHSRSPQIHQLFATQTEIELSYKKVLVPDGQFNAVADTFMQDGTGMQGGTGFNITLPCKLDAWQYVARASDSANLAQAVNTISRSKDGELRGDNTDGAGLVRDLQDNLGWQVKDKKVLVLGAGGAVSGVLSDLLKCSPASVHLCNRTTAKAEALAERLADSRLQAVSRATLGAAYDLVINGTSAGLTQQDVDVPGKIIADHSCCYDMVYGTGVTRFNGWCKQQSSQCDVTDGLGMLVEQAALAFHIWTGRSAVTAPVIQLIRQAL